VIKVLVGDFALGSQVTINPEADLRWPAARMDGLLVVNSVELDMMAELRMWPVLFLSSMG
jgi:hypothetical protein